MPWTIELLVAGYIHKESNRCNLATFVPKVIRDVILTFYGGVFTWNFDGNDLEKFLLMAKYTLKSPLFNVNNISFQCVIEPNNWTSQNTEYVSYHITIPSFNQNIRSITVFYQLRCKETKFMWKCVKILNKNQVKKSWHDSCNTMKISSSKQLHRLHCTCMIDILQIKYYNTEISFNKPIFIQKESQFKYIIKPYELQQNQTFFSKNFGGFENFSIYCAPNGLLRNNIGFIHLGLELYALPANISSIRIKISFQINEGEVQQNIHNFSYEYNSTQIYIAKMNEEYMKHGITITMFLQIMTVIDKYGREISRKHWKQFGVDNTLISNPYIKRGSRIQSKSLPSLPINKRMKQMKDDRTLIIGPRANLQCVEDRKYLALAGLTFYSLKKNIASNHAVSHCLFL